MHLRKLKIENFRSIENIEVEFDKLVSVIVGPNAVGKTTILEAIRFAKAILAPRTQGESANTLNFLGATSPHVPQRMFGRALTNRIEKPTSVYLKFEINNEIKSIEENKSEIENRLALVGSGLAFQNPVQAMNFLNSPQGELVKNQYKSIFNDEFNSITENKNLELEIIIDHKFGSMRNVKPVHSVIFSFIEQLLAPTKSLFSYFPADRAMPVGEQPLQLGSADTNQQLESYNSQPQIKYARLKNTIINAILGSEDGRNDIERGFRVIFNRILKGKELGKIGINHLGFLTIPIKDAEGQTEFEIDSLSSGEKGLILTFLLIGRTISENGMILLDEPELHLNPAVCREWLQFFIDEYAQARNIQAIICSHSTEILAGALEREEHCTLFHLRSGDMLAKVRSHDNSEIREALDRLGASEVETLLYRGTVFVEGAQDRELLQIGFDDILRRYKLSDLGGRRSVEKYIEALQENEKKCEINGKYYFIFDSDRNKTKLENSNSVRICQLPVYCIENYLIDFGIITDLTRDKDISSSGINSVTDAEKKIKEIAFQQIVPFCALTAFKELGLEDAKFDTKFRKKNLEEIISDINSQIVNIKQILNYENKEFSEKFRKNYDSCLQQERKVGN